MKINVLRALRGPNFYANKPMIYMELDIQELEEKPSDQVPGLRERLMEILPSLYEHTCSPGVPGGFLDRIDRGTWAGHVAEHLALELQCLIGHEVSFGKTFTKRPKGIYHVVFRYRDENIGLRVAQMAVEITEKLYHEKPVDIKPYLDELKALKDESVFGPSTRSIVEEAKRRGIGHIRLNEHSYVQLGQGAYQRRIEATLMDNTSALGVEIAADKLRTKKLLQEAGIPVPLGEVVYSEEEALKAAKGVGYPVVVKPQEGNHGRGVTTDITKDEDLLVAFKKAQKIDSGVIVENYLKGFDYRMLLVDYKLVACACREPAKVTGDGKKTIKELIDEVNEDPKRGTGHANVLTKISIDDETLRCLSLLGYTLESIPNKGETLYVKETANISTGGTATNVTDSVHPHNVHMAERMARIIGLNVMGIDIIAKSIEEPFVQGEAGVVEVNAGPGFRMHVHPSSGESINVAEPILDMLFPPDAKHSIPIVAVTGTNGKTTTTRLISHILSLSGHGVGMTSTDGVYVNNSRILKGDYSGPGGAEAIMKDASVTHGVLEVARGGILRRGLGYKRADVGVLLNITSDHLGLSGIETLEDLARVKSTVTEAVKKDGVAVFNADDPMVVKVSKKTRANPMYFSLDPTNPILKKAVADGYCVVTLLGDDVVLEHQGGTFRICDIREVPVTFDGEATFNIQNVLAAVAATYALGIHEESIRAGLISFSPSIAQSPGRMNVIDVGEFKVVIDYGHNVAAVEATGPFIKNLMPGRKIRMTAGVGDRRTEDLLEYGKVISKYFDHVILCDSVPRLREKGKTANLVKEGLLEGGFKEEQIQFFMTEKEATKKALLMAKPGDLVLLQVEDIQAVTEDVLHFKKEFLDERKERDA